MSNWQTLQIADKVREILRSMPLKQPHHFGSPFVSSYQLAIEFSKQFPEATKIIGYPVGGAGTGEHNSLAQYLAGQLSQHIHSGELADIEGAFLHSRYMTDLEFAWSGGAARASAPGSSFDISMFRLKG